ARRVAAGADAAPAAGIVGALAFDHGHPAALTVPARLHTAPGPRRAPAGPPALPATARDRGLPGAGEHPARERPLTARPRSGEPRRGPGLRSRPSRGADRARAPAPLPRPVARPGRTAGPARPRAGPRAARRRGTPRPGAPADRAGARR